ncbi:hypothetical protein ACFJIV_08015 [Mucilaginibacter sp. UC70_90]
MESKLRLAEYKVLLYRLFLGYLFYFIARVLFFAFNTHLFAVDSFWALLKLCYYGMAFDTTALLYINSLFILFSVLPLTVNTRPRFQKGMAILYFITNLLAYATNFVDIIYYRFSQVRSTKATLDVLADENNKKLLFTHFSEAYWYVIIIFILCSLCWIWLYNRVKLKSAAVRGKKKYISYHR